MLYIVSFSCSCRFPYTTTPEISLKSHLIQDFVCGSGRIRESSAILESCFFLFLDSPFPAIECDIIRLYICAITSNGTLGLNKFPFGIEIDLNTRDLFMITKKERKKKVVIGGMGPYKPGCTIHIKYLCNKIEPFSLDFYSIGI